MFRWTQSRAARKFFRSPAAIASLFIIVLYLLVGLYVIVGDWIYSGSETVAAAGEGKGGDAAEPDSESVESPVNFFDPERRVGSQNVPGFYVTQRLDKRLEDCEILLESMERAMKNPNPAKALAELNTGRPVAKMSVDDLRAQVEQGWKIYDKLAVHANLETVDRVEEEIAGLEAIVDELYPPLGFSHNLAMLLGTDRQGRSIFFRAVHSIKIALLIGVITALISVTLGAVLGAAAGYYGGWVDHVITWLYTTFSSIPNIVLLVLIAYVVTPPYEFKWTWINSLLAAIDSNVPLFPVYVAFCSTFWIGTCRVIRGETLKIKQLEYVQAATVTGFGRFRILLRHILPNTVHLMLINFSLLFIGAIKSEVILTFLGFGVKDDPSWGLMITQSASEVVAGFFWQIGSATAFMFVLVLAFNILSDSLQDAFDPKHA